MKSKNPFIVSSDTTYRVTVPMLILAVVLLLFGLGFLPFSLTKSYAASYWSTSFYASSFAGGTGESKENAYLISTPEQLARMAYVINNRYTNKNNASKYFKLTNNISLTKLDSSGNAVLWEPIGTKLYSFSGHFDGCGYTISGMRIKDVSGDYQGFFGYVYVDSENSVTIENVKVSGVISTNRAVSNVGGLTGYIGGKYDAQISNISVNVNINAPSAENVGGMTGSAHGGNFERCMNQGDIVAKKNVGGLIGYSRKIERTETKSGSSVTVSRLMTMESCYNLGNISVSSDGSAVGGLVGYLYGDSTDNYASIGDSYNSGSLDGGISSSSAYNIGGIVGYSGSNTRLSIFDCFNNAIIRGKNNIGGIIGYLSSSTSQNSRSIRRSYNFGDIASVDDCSGGIVGSVDDGLTLQNCFNKGKIVSQNKCGGMIGSYTSTNSSNTLYVTSNTNVGTVIAKSCYSGGIIGSIVPGSRNADTIDIKHCLNKSLNDSYISAGKYYSGGIVGYINTRTATLTIYECWNESKIDCPLVAGGIAGYVNAPCYQKSENNWIGTVERCVNKSQVGRCTRLKDDGNISNIPSNADIQTIADKFDKKQGLYYGGIIGYNAVSSVRVSNCLNTFNRFPVTNVDPSASASWQKEKPSIVVTGQYVGQIIGRNTNDSSPHGINHYVIDGIWFVCYPYGNSGEIKDNGAFWSFNKQYQIIYGVTKSNGDEALHQKSSYYDNHIDDGSIINVRSLPPESRSLSDWQSHVGTLVWSYGNSDINNGLPYFKNWYW